MTGDCAVLTVDLEWFTHTPAYRSARGTTSGLAIGFDGVEFLLEALGDASATFFIVSEIAEERPKLVRRIADAGHEIASHTHTHRLLTTLDPEQYRQELLESRRRLEGCSGGSVTGFRAPAFETGVDHFGELERAGYSYDSSVAPCRQIPGWYGGEHSVQHPVPATRIDPAASDTLAELPVAVMPGVRLPLSGAWLRFFGPRYTALGMRLLARKDIAPVLYVHPWELVDLPAVEGVPRRVYWRTGRWTRRAIERILAQPFTFVTAREAVRGAGEG